jgi:sugar lactone lactonase YvrE
VRHWSYGVFVEGGLGDRKVMGLEGVGGPDGDRVATDGEIWMYILWGWERGWGGG